MKDVVQSGWDPGIGPDIDVRMAKCEECGSWFEEFQWFDVDRPWANHYDYALEEHDCDEHLVRNIMKS